ncbi:MAG TPA: XdhC/CoxI family protein [Tepidisphaeraceae bacterium]|jgi:xanthine dehydrogenase accessory factor|nr:XdhC/CoxI family protein [Tepidisphaeraceae bacterium]
MQLLLDEICKRCRHDEKVVLCTVVGSRGSTPQEKGAKMLVLADGKTIGTLGGGCVEAEVRKQALTLLSADQSRLLEFKLDHDYGWDDGLICGGIMEIFVQVIDRPRSEPFEQIRDALQEDRNTQFCINYEMAGAQRRYIEELGPPPSLIIAGAGHVGHALAHLANTLDFRVTIIDDRPDYISADRFPNATRITGDIEAELRKLAIDASTYVVIVTRGHRHDGDSLHAVIDSPAKYIGLIGSKSKIKMIFDNLAAKNVSREKLLRVHAPIGLEIGAVSVNEIAVSIAAELVATRRGRENRAANPMKIDESQLAAWLDRSKSQ